MSEMDGPTVKIKFVHPFIRHERVVNILNVKNSLRELMKNIFEDTGVHGRYAQRKDQHFDRLRGCIVMRKGAEIGQFDQSGCRIIADVNDELEENEEIIVMLPIFGG